MAWGLLAVAGLLEIVWALALKQADGFTRLWPSLIGVGVALLSLVLLGVALKSLPVSIAYAIWVGIGVFGVAIFGTLFLFMLEVWRERPRLSTENPWKGKFFSAATCPPPYCLRWRAPENGH